MKNKIISSLTSIPANDVNFITALTEYATEAEIQCAVRIMNGRIGTKTRIAACERELRRRKKRNSQISMQNDKILHLLTRLAARRNIPDLHSFIADTDAGHVIVDAIDGGVISISETNESSHTTWSGSLESAASRLESLGLKLDTIRDIK